MSCGHPRVRTTQRASADLSSLIIDWIERHDLTMAEALRILSYELASFTKYLVRAERHDDPEKKADEA